MPDYAQPADRPKSPLFEGPALVSMQCPKCGTRYGGTVAAGQSPPTCPKCPPPPTRTIEQMAAERAAKKAAGTAAPTNPNAPPFDFFKPGTCKSCGAEIWWAKTDKGANAPLDRKPITSMFVEIHTGIVMARRSFINHFSTCPSANQHRTSKPAPKPSDSAT